MHTIGFTFSTMTINVNMNVEMNHYPLRVIKEVQCSIYHQVKKYNVVGKKFNNNKYMEFYVFSVFYDEKTEVYY